MTDIREITRRYMTGEIDEKEYRDSVVAKGAQADEFVGRDKIQIVVNFQAAPFDLSAEPDLDQLRADYLTYLRDAYRYLDMRGVPQVERVTFQLPLDDVYVPLLARPEMPEADTWLRVAGRRWRGEELPEEVLLEEVPFVRTRDVQPVPVEEALERHPALVVLGDPGAGKSTLLKMLALNLARELQGPLPILLPLNAYADELQRGRVSLHDFLAQYYAARQHRLSDLKSLFDAALEAGQAVVLLDGLDEVQARRGFVGQFIEDFAREHVPAPKPHSQEPLAGNRVIVTSRIVGYRQAPLIGKRWRTYTLADWGREEFEHFADRWCTAFEITTKGDTPEARAAAEQEREELLAAIFASESIERLASNPLLLTIMALIKRQRVTLPRERVRLYELYLETLISAWNKARSLDRRPVGPEMDYLGTVQVLAPLALWLRETNPTAGLVSRAALENWLTDYYQEEWDMARGPACAKAREFLRGVHQYSNLLVERGRDQYGFLHLTFEEMLAAKGIAQQGQLGLDKSMETICKYWLDPAWRETILLAVGVWGIVQQQPRVAGQVLRELCKTTLEGDDRGRNVVLAGEALEDVGQAGVGKAVAQAVTDALVRTMQSAETPPHTRRQAGLILGRLGWQPEGGLDAWIEIPPGKFLYGEEKEEREITYAYRIGKYPVTNVQYARFLEAGGYQERRWWSDEGWSWRQGTYDSKAPDYLKSWLAKRPAEKRDRPFWWDDRDLANPLCPVVGVSWFEAEAYCNWLSAERDEEIRLPTEEEWERAVRGVDGWRYPWGDEFDFTRLNCADFWAGRELDDDAWDKWWDSPERELVGPTPVSTYPQGTNPAGLWDGAGNVWEWTDSWYGEGETRVLRGGSWDYFERYARCAYRGVNDPAYFNDNIGFRVCALALPSDC